MRFLKWSFGFAVGLFIIAIFFNILVSSGKSSLFVKSTGLGQKEIWNRFTTNRDFTNDKTDSLQVETSELSEQLNIDIAEASVVELKKRVEQIDQQLENEQFYSQANKGFLSKPKSEKYAQLLRLRSELYKELISKKIKNLEENI